MNSSVDAYIAKAPASQRETLTELRETIRKAMPKAEEVVEGGFPVYKVGGQWTAGFATRKKGPMLYIMVHEVLDRYAETLGALRSGKSCVEFRETEHTSRAALRKLAAKMLAEARKART